MAASLYICISCSYRGSVIVSVGVFSAETVCWTACGYERNSRMSARTSNFLFESSSCCSSHSLRKISIAYSNVEKKLKEIWKMQHTGYNSRTRSTMRYVEDHLMSISWRSMTTHKPFSPNVPFLFPSSIVWQNPSQHCPEAWHVVTRWRVAAITSVLSVSMYSSSSSSSSMQLMSSQPLSLSSSLLPSLKSSLSHSNAEGVLNTLSAAFTDRLIMWGRHLKNLRKSCSIV